MRNHKVIYASSYDRGLEHLLDVWGGVVEAVPDAELHIFYGWNLFDRAYSNNPERMAWKEKINKKMEQPGITHHGRVSKEELKKWENICGIWAYPTHFGEIHCITALDNQAQGCVPVVIDYAALEETVQTGIKIHGDIYDDDTKEEYKNALISLMKDEKKWEEESDKGKEFAKNFTWDKIADQWTKYFV